MCQPRPGLRCSSHAEEGIKKAIDALAKSIDANDTADVSYYKEKLDRAYMDYGMTEKGQKRLTEAIERAKATGNPEAVKAAEGGLKIAQDMTDKKKVIAHSYKQALTEFERNSFSPETINNIGENKAAYALQQARSSSDPVASMDSEIQGAREKLKDAASASKIALDNLDDKVYNREPVESKDIYAAAAHTSQIRMNRAIVEHLESAKLQLTMPELFEKSSNN